MVFSGSLKAHFLCCCAVGCGPGDGPGILSWKLDGSHLGLKNKRLKRRKYMNVWLARVQLSLLAGDSRFWRMTSILDPPLSTNQDLPLDPSSRCSLECNPGSCPWFQPMTHPWMTHPGSAPGPQLEFPPGWEVRTPDVNSGSFPLPLDPHLPWF